MRELHKLLPWSRSELSSRSAFGMSDARKRVDAPAADAGAEGAAAAEDAPPFPGCFKGECTPFGGYGKEPDPKDTRQCWLVRCAALRCNTSVCTTHGWGDGCHEGYGSGVNDFSYDNRCCSAPDCHKHYCMRHYEQETTACKPCSDVLYAQASFGAYNRSLESRFCREHPVTRCTRRVGWEEDKEDEEDKEEDEEDKVCGFMCCASCLRDHMCGDDKRDYL